MKNKVKEIQIKYQLNHMYDVQNYMFFLELNRDKLPFKIPEWSIIYKAMTHDIDKFNGDMAKNYCKVREHILNGVKINYDELNKNKDLNCIVLHHANNTHHFEYHDKNNTDFSNLEICEMCCDMASKSKIHHNEVIQYFKENILNKSDFIKKHKDEFLSIFQLLKDTNENYTEKALIKKQFIERQLNHIRMVQENMILLELNMDKLPFNIPEWEIIYRSMFHDIDKFSPDLASKFYLIEEYHDNKKNNKSNDYIDKDKLYECCDIHYSTQRHHTEYHKKHNEDFSNLDLCEFCADITACAERNKNDPEEYFLKNQVNNDPFLQKHKDEICNILGLLKTLKVKKEKNNQHTL